MGQPGALGVGSVWHREYTAKSFTGLVAGGGDQSHEMCSQIRVVSESGAGGARLRIFGAGPPAPNLHLGSEILEPAPEFRSRGAAATKCKIGLRNLGAQARLHQSAQRHATQVKSRWSPAPSFWSPAPFFGAETCCAKSAPRLRNLEPAPDFGAQVRLQQGAQTHTTRGITFVCC